MFNNVRTLKSLQMSISIENLELIAKPFANTRTQITFNCLSTINKLTSRSVVEEAK